MMKIISDMLFIPRDSDTVLAAKGIMKLGTTPSPTQLLWESREKIKVKLTYNIVLEEFRELYLRQCKNTRQRIKHFMRLKNVLYVCAVENEIQTLLSAISNETISTSNCPAKISNAWSTALPVTVL